MEIPEIPPARIEKQASLKNDAAADKDRTRQDPKPEPDLLRMRHQRMGMADIFSPSIHDQAMGQGDLHSRIGLKKGRDRSQRSRQVLFVAVELRQNLAGGAAITAVDRI